MAHTKFLRFVKATGTGTQTVAGVGFEGKCALFWTSWLSSHGTAAGVELGFGLTDGVTQSCRYMLHPDAQNYSVGAAVTSAQAERGDRVFWRTTATAYNTETVANTATATVEGEFTGFTSDGFTIDWSVNDGSAAIINCVVLGGNIEAKLSQVKITTDASAADADQDVSGIGFEPTAFIVLGGAADESGGGYYSIGAPFGSMHGFGFSDLTSQYSVWTLGRASNVPGGTWNRRGQHYDRVASIRFANTSSAGDDSCSIAISAAHSDGYTVTRLFGSDDTYQPIQHILALRGVTMMFDAIASRSSPGTRTLSLPARPSLAFIQGTTGSAVGSASAAGDMEFAFGAWSRDGAGGVWVGGEDNDNPSVFKSESYDDVAFSLRPPVGGTRSFAATVTDTADDGTTTITLPASVATGFTMQFIGIASAPKVGSIAMGYKATVTASRSALISLREGYTNSTTGLCVIDGDLLVTGNVTVADDLVVMRRAVVTITDAQIKALPTTPATFLVAQGAGLIALPSMACLLAKIAVAYTNIDPDAYLVAQFSNGTVWSGFIANISADSRADLSYLLTTATSRSVLREYQGDALTLSDQWGPLSVPNDLGDNLSLRLRINNGLAGNLTGGGGANEMRVVTYYSVEEAP